MATKKKKDIPESKLGSFNMRAYLGNKKEDPSEDAAERQGSGPGKEDSGNKSGKTAAKSRNGGAPAGGGVRNKTAASSAAGRTTEEKIPFMNYLPPDVHDDFSQKFLESKRELRQRTGKALSQTELVEAILRHIFGNWSDEKDNVLAAAEEIINNRRGKDSVQE